MINYEKDHMVISINVEKILAKKKNTLQNINSDEKGRKVFILMYCQRSPEQCTEAGRKWKAFRSERRKYNHMFAHNRIPKLKKKKIYN